MPRRVYPNLHAFFRDHRDVRMMDIADELGISYSLLSMIKWGSRQPRLELALKLAERCNVPLESLLLPKGRKAS
jgi:transcriptional regulator with XRE-family HTH domain